MASETDGHQHGFSANGARSPALFRGVCSLFTWTVQAALAGGLIFGSLEAIRRGWPYRSAVPFRAWADIISFSGLGHGIFWVVLGFIFLAISTLGYILGFCFRCMGWSWTLRRQVLALVVMVSILVLYGDVPRSLIALYGYLGFGVLYYPLVLGYLLATVAIGCATIHYPWGRFARGVRRTGWIVFLPSLGLCVGFLAVQWHERPILREPTTRWKEARSASGPMRDKPNIIFVVLDTQRVDRLGCYGYRRPTTPQLDAFAADSHLFENCLSTSIWTIPSHASMFTGLMPSEHGAGSGGHSWLEDRFQTLGCRLQDLGYETIAFSNNEMVGAPCFGLDRGFDRVFFPIRLHEARRNLLDLHLKLDLYSHGYANAWLSQAVTQDQGGKFTSQMIAHWLDGRDHRRPFFLFVNYMEVHSAPLQPGWPYRKQFVRSEDFKDSYALNHSFDDLIRFSLLKQDCYTPQDLNLLSDLYDGETRQQDDYLGELFDAIAQRVSFDDTLVIVTSDHGENLGEHHLLSHCWCVYDTLAHVPLIIRYPKRLPPGRSKELAQTIDLMPTILDAVHGQPVPTNSTLGVSLLSSPIRTGSGVSATSTAVPGLRSGVSAERSAIIEYLAGDTPRGMAEALARDPSANLSSFKGTFRAIRRGQWKYIINPDRREELFDVGEDPGELRNQAESRRMVAESMAQELGRWSASPSLFVPRANQDKPRELPRETRDRLRALGYL